MLNEMLNESVRCAHRVSPVRARARTHTLSTIKSIYRIFLGLQDVGHSRAWLQHYKSFFNESDENCRSKCVEGKQT